MIDYLDITKICNALKDSLNSVKEIRTECEEYLKEVSKTNGYVNVILNIIKSNTIDTNVRLCASVFLKNNVKKNYQTLTNEETIFLTKEIYESLLLFDINEKQIYNQLFEIMRLLINYKIPYSLCIIHIIIEKMNIENDERTLYVSIYCLKLIFKKLKNGYKKQDNFKDEITIEEYLSESCVDIIFYNVTKIMFYLKSYSDLNNGKVCDIYCEISKLYNNMFENSYVKTETFLRYTDNFFVIFDCILKHEINVENYMEDENYLITLPQYKCKRIVLSIVVNFIAQYANRNYNDFTVESTKQFSNLFTEKYIFIFFDCFISILKAYKINKKTLTQECLLYIILGLTYGIENANIYNQYIKDNIQFLIEDVIFPVLCYSEEDVEKVIYNQYEYTLNQFSCENIQDLYSCSVDFIQSLTRYRCSRHLPYLYNFCESIFKKYNENYNFIYKDCIQFEKENKNQEEKDKKTEMLLNNYLCKYKYSALSIIQSLIHRLSDKKRNMNIEEFLLAYIEMDIISFNHLLCYKSMIVYTYFIHKVANIQDNERLIKNYELFLNNMTHPHLLVRITSASHIIYFFKIENNYLKETIIKSLPKLIERLINIINEAKFENVINTLDSLSHIFKDHINAHIEKIIITLSSCYTYLINKMLLKKEDANYAISSGMNFDLNLNKKIQKKKLSKKDSNEEEKDIDEYIDVSSASLSTITVILNLLDSLDEKYRTDIYSSTLPYLYNVIDDSFKIPDLEHFEEAVSLLTNVTYYLDITEEMYMKFEKLYDIFYFNCDEELKNKEILLIKNNPMYAISIENLLHEKEQEDLFYNFIYDISYAQGVIDNIASKKTEQFIQLFSNTYCMKYTHMVFRLAVYAFHCNMFSRSSKILFILFEATIRTKGIDELIEPVLNLFYTKVLKNEELTIANELKKMEDNIKTNLNNNPNNTLPNDFILNNQGSNMTDNTENEKVLSKTQIEYIKQLFYSMLIYDIEKFFLYFHNKNNTNQILAFISNFECVKLNKTRKLYILAMCNLLENINNPLINIPIEEVNNLIKTLIHIGNVYCENKYNKDESNISSYSDYSSSNSEIDLEEHEDAKLTKVNKLLKKVQNLKNKDMLKLTDENQNPQIEINNAYLHANNTATNNIHKKQQEIITDDEEEDDDDDEDDDDEYDYDDSIDNSEDDYREGLLDNYNPLTLLHDVTNSFYTKYNNMYDRHIIEQIVHLIEYDNSLKEKHEATNNEIEGVK